MPEFIWRTEDYEGVETVLVSSVWHDKVLHPILGHLEVKDYLKEIKLSVHAPEAVFASVRDQPGFEKAG